MSFERLSMAELISMAGGSDVNKPTQPQPKSNSAWDDIICGLGETSNDSNPKKNTNTNNDKKKPYNKDNGHKKKEYNKEKNDNHSKKDYNKNKSNTKQDKPIVNKEPEIKYNRKNYTVIKVRQIPKPLKSLIKVTGDVTSIDITTDITLFDLNPLHVDLSKSTCVDNDLELMVSTGRITPEVRDTLVKLYIEGERELMEELKNLLFSIHSEVIKNERMTVEEWDALICSYVSGNIVNREEYRAFLRLNNLDASVNLIDNEYYLVEHIKYIDRESNEMKSEFFRLVSYGQSEETTDMIHVFRK